MVRVVRAQEPEPGVGGLRERRGHLPVAPPRSPRRGLHLVRRHRERRQPHRRHGRTCTGGGRRRRFGAVVAHTGGELRGCGQGVVGQEAGVYVAQRRPRRDPVDRVPEMTRAICCQQQIDF